MLNASRMLLALAGLMMIGLSPAHAVEYPYCMTHVEGWSGVIERCDFMTMEQCQASAGGLNGSCAPNRRAAPPARFSPDAADGRRRVRRR
jgi:hypothetical protein